MAKSLMRLAIIALVAATVVHSEVTVSFVDNSAGSFFKDGTAAQTEGLSREDLTATISSLLSIGALSKIDAATSEKVGHIVKASPFDKPQAVAVLVLAGLQTGSSSGATTYSMASKEDTLSALAAVAGAGGVEHTSLDVASLSGCGDVCLEALLLEAIDGLGLDANYTPGKSSLAGKLAVRNEGKEAVLDLESVADRLLAIEVASTWRSMLDAVAVAELRSGMDAQSGSRHPQLLDRVLVSAQAVKDTYGTDSPQYEAACCLLHKVMDFTMARLQAAYDGRFAAVKASIESSEMQGGAEELLGLLNWSTQSQRTARSLLEANDSADDLYVESFIAWVVMWGVFLLLLFFAISGCHCLKGMKFKQDSLLYGKSKAE